MPNPTQTARTASPRAAALLPQALRPSTGSLVDPVRDAVAGPGGGAVADPLADPLAAPPAPAAAPAGTSAMGDDSGAPSTSGHSSSMSLKAERAGLYAKKYAARALDVGLFAPAHLIDQASILDVHAADAVNFAASGKTRAQRGKKGIDDRWDYDPKHTWGFTGSENGRKKLRESGRTHLRPMMNTGAHAGMAMKQLSNDGFLARPKWDWGESVTGINPVRELHRASMPEDASPETKDNTRLSEIRDQLRAKKDARRAKKAGLA